MQVFLQISSYSKCLFLTPHWQTYFYGTHKKIKWFRKYLCKNQAQPDSELLITVKRETFVTTVFLYLYVDFIQSLCLGTEC